MTVNPILSSQSLLPIQLSSPGFQSQSASPSGTDGADLSSPAQFFSELKQLSTQDPAQFKTLTAEVAQKLDAAAQNTSDPAQAAQLKAIAARFDQASQTGDFSSLLPPDSASAQTHHGGRHHHGGHHASSGNSSANDTLSSIFASVGQQIQTNT
jgi:hypothetical protein